MQLRKREVEASQRVESTAPPAYHPSRTFFPSCRPSRPERQLCLLAADKAETLTDRPRNKCDIRVSVVIPTYKIAESVRRAVLSLFDQDLPKHEYEIIVVDSSPDDSVVRAVTELQSRAPCSLRVITKVPEGPGPSRNLGARESRGEFIAMMDSDCWAAPAWLREGLNAFEERVGLIQGRTLPEPGVPRGIFTWYVQVEEENFVYECANILFRRSAFEQTGGFSSEYNCQGDFVFGGEDVDLAWRIKRNGWESRFAPAALVFHEVQPIPITRWLFIKRQHLWPRLAKTFPELRQFFFARYFFDRHQAALLVGIVGTILAMVTPWSLLAWAPYVLSRGCESTRSLRGPLRLIRVMVYLPRDIMTMGLLAHSSVKHRSLLL